MGCVARAQLHHPVDCANSSASSNDHNERQRNECSPTVARERATVLPLACLRRMETTRCTTEVCFQLWVFCAPKLQLG